jgi:radical SAM superfamily enzyme YgiQ (UPF0313 family)
MRKLGFGTKGFDITWGCNAKANVPYDVLKEMKAGGCRVLLVGYESGNQQILHNIKKGLRTDVARQFTKDAHSLGLTIHGTFILGLPGETLETIEETIKYAIELNPYTIQVSLAAPYPGTFLYKQAVENNWFDGSDHLLTDGGNQIAQLSYPHLSAASSSTRWKSSTSATTSARARSPDRGRDAARLGHDEAPPARRRGILRLPAPRKEAA